MDVNEFRWPAAGVDFVPFENAVTHLNVRMNNPLGFSSAGAGTPCAQGLHLFFVFFMVCKIT